MPQLPTQDDQPAAPATSVGSLLSSLSTPFTACLPQPSSGAAGSRNTSTGRSDAGNAGWTSIFGGSRSAHPSGSGSASRSAAEERQGLLRSDDYDDSDAISLLSNIVERDGRGSAASRRRARARRRAARENNGMGWSDVGQLMACGLFGRAKGQIQSREITRGSSSSTAAARHRRTLSESSAESDGSLTAAARIESGDEDAGMLDDQAIRNLSLNNPPPTEAQRNDEDDAATVEASRQAEAEAQKKRDEEEAAEEQAEAEARAKVAAEEAKAEAERKRQREEEAERAKREAEAEEAKQREEEAKLAAEEEAAIAKARRRAERKAAKAGLLKMQQETRSAQRWRTEAEAEAAAGGFDFAEDEHDAGRSGNDGEEAYGQQQYFDDGVEGGQDDEAFYYPHDGAEYGHGQGDEYVVEEHHPGGGGGVVHHHHYYHGPSPVTTSPHDFLSPPLSHGLPTSFSPQSMADQFDDAEEDRSRGDNDADARSEDEADIAGLSFGKKKKKPSGRGGSDSGSRSGGGRARRGVPGGSNSQHSGGSGSAGGYRSYLGGGGAAMAAPSSSSASVSSSAWNAGKPSYRDRPRRHERQGSRSSNSSSGLHVGGGGGMMVDPSRPSGPSPGGSASGSASYAIPSLPNLYEQDSTLPIEGQSALYTTRGVAPPSTSTSTSYDAPVGGAGRKKRSYRDKRSGNGETASAGSNNSSNVKVSSSPVVVTTPSAGAGGFGGGTFNSPRNPTEFGRWRDREPATGGGGGGGGFDGVPGF